MQQRLVALVSRPSHLSKVCARLRSRGDRLLDVTLSCPAGRRVSASVTCVRAERVRESREEFGSVHVMPSYCSNTDKAVGPSPHR